MKFTRLNLKIKIKIIIYHYKYIKLFIVYLMFNKFFLLFNFILILVSNIWKKERFQDY